MKRASKIAKDAEDEPGVGVARSRQNDVEAGEEAEGREEGEDDQDDPLPDG